MIPPNEIDNLTMIVVGAVDMAAEARLADGNTWLPAGLQRAEEIAEEEVGWGTELVSRWRPACENYAREHGVKIQ